MTDTEKVVPFEIRFRGMAANIQDVGAKFRAWFEEQTHFLRNIDHGQVPNDVANASLDGAIRYDGSGYSDAAFSISTDDIPPERHEASDPPPADIETNP